MHQRQHHVEHRGAEHRRPGDREQDVGEGHHRVDDPHHRRVEPAEEAGDEAEQRAGEHRAATASSAIVSEQRRAEDDAREDVAAELVGAEPGGSLGGLQAVDDGRSRSGRTARPTARSRAPGSERRRSSTTPATRTSLRRNEAAEDSSRVSAA